MTIEKGQRFSSAIDAVRRLWRRLDGDGYPPLFADISQADASSPNGHGPEFASHLLKMRALLYRGLNL
jgi:hypothetical protein